MILDRLPTREESIGPDVSLHHENTGVIQMTCPSGVEPNLQRIVQSYEDGNIAEPIMPVIYLIEPTNDCNYRCVMCPSSEILKKSYADFSLFKEIVDEICGVAKVIKLNYLGEPLLHKDIAGMIRYCRDHTSAKISMSTNGSLLNGALSREIVDAGLDEIIFSLDANSERVYTQIRKGGDFQKVVRNIENFLEIVGNKDKPNVIIKLIEMNANKHEIQSFKERWGKHRCTVCVSWFNTWANQMCGCEDLSSSLSPNRDVERLSCADLWFQMVVTSAGEVVLCCNDCRNSCVLGNVKDDSIAAIWNGKAIRDIRRVHRQGNYPGICEQCIEWSKREDIFGFFQKSKRFPAGKP